MAALLAEAYFLGPQASFGATGAAGLGAEGLGPQVTLGATGAGAWWVTVVLEVWWWWW